MGLMLDIVIVASLIGLSFQSLYARSLFRCILHFVVFGLAMSLVWARLNTPDLAMAEAAIGAGVTGALTMVAFRRLMAISPAQNQSRPSNRSRLALPIALGAGGLVALLGLAVLEAEPVAGLAGMAVMEALPSTGLQNPVTAVLLSFRGYDTLLEISVLLAALLASQAVTQLDDPDPSILTEQPDTPLVGALLAMIVPLSVLVSVHLLKAGSLGTGGAFQAGAVMAGCGVILALSGRLTSSAQPSLLINLGLSIGILSFIGIGLVPLLYGQPLLALPDVWAVYLLESTMMISIALILLLLFTGSISIRRSDG
ncbi:MAG: Na(+)/H(+) antiporter subunit B [Wenzhouxiangella sp.]|jgi:multisubunit Na+/H+ antiporter MnhB subunit|nr:Na(+)/H(+) antiporter subunit B [Wenzhouxiangella sp.]